VTTKTYQKFLGKIKTSSPLVLCLTNTVTVTDCANGLLAIGASPVMSEDPEDAQALAGLAQALVVNIGTINPASQAVMEAAVAVATERGIPVTLDPVGAGASQRRLSASMAFLAPAGIVRGNASEILALAGHGAGQKGVDSSSREGEEALVENAAKLAQRAKAIVAVSGPADFITDGHRVIKIEGGTPLLTKLTGTGCLLTALVGAYVGASPGEPLLATAAAHVHLAKAGEMAQARLERPMSLGSFKVALFDELARMEGSELDNPSGKAQWRLDA
jgi:hydroxyethylthiazole kinase